MASREIPDIPLYKVAPVGDVFKPTSTDKDSGINDMLTQVLQQPDFSSPVTAGKHRMIPHPATLPHTHGEHTVYWVDKNAGKNPTAWQADSWLSLAQDTEFLQRVEEFIQEKQNKNPKLRVYFFMGFSHGDNPQLEHVTPFTMQSQQRTHLHAVSFDYEGEAQSLDPENDRHKTYLTFMLNFGGEHAIQAFGSELEKQSFGKKFSFTQRLGTERRAQVERTMFGFSSLQEALTQSLLLVENVQGNWMEYLKTLKTAYNEFSGLSFPVIQSIIPNMAFLFPSEEDRKFAGEKNTFAVWTMPFTTTGFHSAIPQGGVITERG